MKEAMALTLITAILGMVHPVMAQSEMKVTPATPQLMTPVPTLEERFQKCIGNPDCPLEERLQIMSEMSDSMHSSIMGMDQFCRGLQYSKDCIGPRNERAQHWRMMNRHMKEMMGSIAPPRAEDKQQPEKSSAAPMATPEQDKSLEMSKEEPAAGEPEAPVLRQEKRPWWRYFGN